MKIGVIQLSLVADDPAESFALAAKAGLDGLEITCNTPAEAVDLLSADGIARIRRLKKTHKIEVPTIGLGLLRESMGLFGPPETADAAEEVIGRAIAAASEIGADVVLLPFLGQATIQVEEELDRVIAALDALAADAEDAGVTLGIESTLNVNQQQYLLEHLGAYTSVKVYYDTGNALARRSDPATFLRDLGRDRVCRMHFKDVRLGEEGAPPDFDVALGEGDVDFAAVVSAIGALEYDGWIVLETPPTSDPLAAAKANLAFARSVLGS